MIIEKDKLIPSYLSYSGLENPHIDSFNYFIEQCLEQIVKSPMNQCNFSIGEEKAHHQNLDIYISEQKIQHPSGVGINILYEGSSTLMNLDQ